MLPPDINALRLQANQFMTTLVTLFKPELSYDAYGQQTAMISGEVQVSGYVGRLSGRDRELLEGQSGYRSAVGRRGVETTQLATLLLPYGTVIENDFRVIVGGNQYDVVWNNNDTSDLFKAYTKAIISKVDRVDEEIAFSTAIP